MYLKFKNNKEGRKYRDRWEFPGSILKKQNKKKLKNTPTVILPQKKKKRKILNIKYSWLPGSKTDQSTQDVDNVEHFLFTYTEENKRAKSEQIHKENDLFIFILQGCNYYDIE